MLITALEITDYKRVRKVAITPDADRHVQPSASRSPSSPRRAEGYMPERLQVLEDFLSGKREGL